MDSEDLNSFWISGPVLEIQVKRSSLCWNWKVRVNPTECSKQLTGKYGQRNKKIRVTLENTSLTVEKRRKSVG